MLSKHSSTSPVFEEKVLGVQEKVGIPVLNAVRENRTEQDRIDVYCHCFRDNKTQLAALRLDDIKNQYKH